MKSATEVSDHELLSHARKGDQNAFRVLVERYEPQVAATVIGMLGRGPDAEDVGQATFIRFYRALADFREDSTIGTYLTRIAINLSLNELKKRKRERNRMVSQEEKSIDVEDTESIERVDSRERARIVHQAIDTLPRNYKAVVVLRIIRGFSTKETARLLDIPVGTVLSRLSRAQIRLKEVLSPLLGD